MITNYETKDLKLNANLRGLRIGNVIKIKVDKDGTIVDRYWRSRMKDSAIDNCVEFVEKKKSIKRKTEVTDHVD